MTTGAADLDRFLRAQGGGVFERAVAELGTGRKRSHWMWFVFPQLQGLGRSATAQAYAIANLAEARAYLAHPVLGPRLLEAMAAAEASGAGSLHPLFGSPDDLKFRSSMTLFDAAAPAGPYADALARWCADVRCPLTLAALAT